MPIESKECFTDLTLDGQLYEILRALIASSADIKSINGDTTAAQVIAGSAPLSAATAAGTTTISSTQAGASTAGFLSSTDWNTFNNKQPALGFTAVPDTRTISTTSPITGGGNLSANRTIAMPAATTSVSGHLTSTDWNTFNDKTYCLTLGHSSTTLAAGGTNAYFSNIFDLAPVGTYDRRQFNVHRNGVVIAASLSFYNGGGATPAGHSGATMSLWDVTTNASVGTLVSYNVDGVATLNSSTYLATGLNIPIVAGTLYNIYLQAGTFTTNPTSVRQTINLFIR